jgi:general secretion pathway protein L
MLTELKDLFAVWIAAVAAAIEAMLTRIVPQRKILLVEGDGDIFTARVTSAGKETALPEMSFRLVHGSAEPPFSEAWQTTLRGSRISVLMRPDHFLFRAVDFPKAAIDFLEGMIRAQIDRLTPWTATDAVFGMTVPKPIAGERITLMLAATPQQKIQPLLRFVASLGAASVAGLVDVPEAFYATKEPVKVFHRSLTDAAGGAVDVPRLLCRTLLGASLAAAASLAISAYVGSVLDAEQQELQNSIAQRRAALRIHRTGGSAETLLARRKQTSPSSVMALEAISRVLPDTTYVTELRVEGDKLQVVGLTQDAPSLIRLIEQSPQFTRATFFAPTTRSQNEPGERFHIEAHITPYFGSAS